MRGEEVGAGQAQLRPRRSRAALEDAFSEASGFVVHPLLKGGAVLHRPYQVALARASLAEPTLVVLPAGLGKTQVAILVAAERLRQAGGFVLVLAPNRPTARRLKADFEAALAPSLRVEEVTGRTSRAAMVEAFEKGALVVATPETMAGELASGRLGLGRCSLLVVDEAHRAVGDFAYVEAAKALRRDRPGGLVLALTSSPTRDRRRTAALVDALGLRRVEARTRRDQDVRPFAEPAPFEVVEVELDEPLKRIQALLERELEGPLARLVSAGAMPASPAQIVGRRQLRAAGEALRRKRGGDRGPFFEGLKAHAQAMVLIEALEVCETQGARPLLEFLDRLGSEPNSSRTEKAMASSRALLEVSVLARAHAEALHPQVALATALVRDLVRDRPGARALVVAAHHGAAAALAAAISRPPPLGPGLRAARFQGPGALPQAGTRAGLSPDEVVRGLADGRIQVIVLSEPGVLGLPMPDIDLTVLFLADASEIRGLQRSGLPGQAAASRVVALVGQGTRAELPLDADRPGENDGHGTLRWLTAGGAASHPTRGRNRALPIEGSETAPTSGPSPEVRG